MNDADMLSTVREALPGIRLETPLEDTVRRGRSLRARRRAGWAGRAAAATAGAAALASFVAVSATSGGATPPSPGKTTLDAWSVTRGPHDTITITIRQLYDAAGLQQTLRADGIPARVEFQPGDPTINTPLPAGCTAPAISDEEEAKILGQSIPSVVTGVALTIHTTAIPAGIGIFLAAYTDDGNEWGWTFDAVVAAPSCTGRPGLTRRSARGRSCSRGRSRPAGRAPRRRG